MEIRETKTGIEVNTSVYRLLLERAGGFAARQVEIVGPGRLDRFDRAGEGPHPTCMHFDNMTVNNTFQLAHYGKTNSSATAKVDGTHIELSGRLIPVIAGACGNVGIRKRMLCLEPRTGRTLWEGDLGGKAVFQASPTGADGRIYCLNMNGEAVVLAAGDRFQVLHRANMGGKGVRATIAVSDGQLFLRTDTELFCIGKRRR